MEELRRVKEWAAADSKGEAPEEVSRWLRNEGLDLWIDALTDLVMEVDATFAERKGLVAEAKAAGWAPHVQRQAVADHERWKRNALTFKRHVVARLSEAKRIRHERAQSAQGDRMDWLACLRSLCADMADFIDDLMEGGAIAGEDFARADELLDRVPEWIDRAGAPA